MLKKYEQRSEQVRGSMTRRTRTSCYWRVNFVNTHPQVRTLHLPLCIHKESDRLGETYKELLIVS